MVKIVETALDLGVSEADTLEIVEVELREDEIPATAAEEAEAEEEIVEVDKRETVTEPSCECGVSDAENVEAEEEKFEAEDTMLDA